MEELQRPEEIISPQGRANPTEPTQPTGSTGPSIYEIKYSPEQREGYIKAFEQSGLNQREFCEAQGLIYTTFNGWRQKYAKQGQKGLRLIPNNYTLEYKQKAVEAWQKSGMGFGEFAKVWGCHEVTLRKWARRYEMHGVKGLERITFGVGRKRKIASGVMATITDIKKKYPLFGLRKVRDFLVRFKAIKVSTGTVRRVLRESNIRVGQAPARKWRKKAQIRFFERSRPGELWQSDITSFVLTRRSQRIYLVAFLDDYSRYVVSWAMHLQQRGEMVVECLLEGISKYGKPLEVLTDQGRQYFSWRGKGEFQKVLIREGIKHVVARSHHPQTVGKTERFWGTVGTEFWARVQPQELAEAQERFRHFVAHYNHFRPHQGIGGMVPADRFFGVESQVRKALEKEMSQNELLMAIGESPRKPVFLIGQIGDQQVSMHGERGKLVIQTPGGVMQEMEYNELGGIPRDGGSHGGGTQVGDTEGERAQAGKETEDKAGEDQAAAPDAGAGEGAMGVSVGGGEEAGARDRSDHAGSMAGSDEPGGSGEKAGDPSPSDLAAIPAGGIGNGGGAFEAAQDAKKSAEGAAGGVVTGCEGDGEAHPRTGAADGHPEGADRAVAGDAGAQGVEAGA